MDSGIRSKADLFEYLERDRKALGVDRRRPRLLGDEIWRFEILLRKVEYRTGAGMGIVNRALAVAVRVRLHRLGTRLGFSIPAGVFGPGLSIAHVGTIVVNGAARVGADCRIHACTNIGTTAGKQYDVPTIGNNVYIGPGAKIFGPITIADGVIVGANAVVNRSCETPNVTIGGVPAKVIGDRGTDSLG